MRKKVKIYVHVEEDKKMNKLVKYKLKYSKTLMKEYN
jgi:hypothetical protein